MPARCDSGSCIDKFVEWQALGGKWCGIGQGSTQQGTAVLRSGYRGAGFACLPFSRNLHDMDPLQVLGGWLLPLVPVLR